MCNIKNNITRFDCEKKNSTTSLGSGMKFCIFKRKNMQMWHPKGKQIIKKKLERKNFFLHQQKKLSALVILNLPNGNASSRLRCRVVSVFLFSLASHNFRIILRILLRSESTKFSLRFYCTRGEFFMIKIKIFCEGKTRVFFG